MIGGDLCLLTNVFASFYISGVCSDIHSFNNSAPEFECFSQDLTDVVDSVVNSTTFFTVSPSAVCRASGG